MITATATSITIRTIGLGFVCFITKTIAELRYFSLTEQLPAGTL